MLLPIDRLKKYLNPGVEEHLIIYYSHHDLNTADGKLFSTTHTLIQIGNNTKTAPDYFSMYDGSTMRLIDFEARLIKRDGAETTFGYGDLNTIKTSSSYSISETEIKILPITEVIEAGDVLEMVYKHEDIIPATGIQFSPALVGNYGLNIEYLLEIQKNDSLNYKLFNDNISPEIINKENTKVYKFEWNKFSKNESTSPFKHKNTEPSVYITVPRYFNENSESITSINNWIDFGNWYLELINPMFKSNSLIDGITAEITKGKTNDLEKMNAIFQYCQKNIRYEQVYLSLGELIPNKCDVVLKRKYGDCKDYSTLIYTMAKSIGLNPNFALCYRGRGNMFYKDIPVSQFNHVIIHFEDNGKHYWYDGTNRTGIPGITTMDLINQPALIIDKDLSHFVTIEEVESNLLNITASLSKKESSLKGNLKISLSHQYAILFFYLDFYYNNIKMQEYLIDWVKSNLSHNFMIQNIGWDKTSNEFKITINCEIPNCVVDLNGKSYISFNNILPNLFGQNNLPDDSNELYYFSGYNRVKINCIIDNLTSLQNNKNNFEIKCNFPTGPFSNEERIQFQNEFQNIKNIFNTRNVFRKVN